MAKKISGPRFFQEKKSTEKKSRDTQLKANTRPQQRVASELRIDRLSAEGRGMVFDNGKPIFVATALPGELVSARVTTDKRDFSEADLLEIIEPSSQRCVPKCGLFGRCGGCQLQMLNTDDQLAHKQNTLQRLLQPFVTSKRANASDEIWAQSLTAEPWHYRHRARLAVAEQNDKPIIGFKAANSHRVLAVPACPILDERLQPLLAQLPEWLAQLAQWRRIDEVLLVVDSAGQIGMAWRAQRAFPKADAEKLEALCRAANVRTGSEAALTYAVPSQATSIAFGPDDFTQVNPAINDQLASRVSEWLAPTADDRVADFFCGLGNFTLPLTRHAAVVDGYEISAAMVQRARDNAQQLQIDNAKFHRLDLFEPIERFPAPMTMALLDPPRAGAKALCEKLASLKSLRRIVYVSCNPQTLTRDIGILADGGFELRRAALVDMFPQTGHSEAIVCLERR
jgi:23S rRNA (uracil1939-C5)-methyltransferase